MDTALPKLENAPAPLQQLGFVPEVALYVLVEFRLPELLSGLGSCVIPTARVSVPKAALNENAEVVTWKHHARPAWKLLAM